MKNIKVHPGLVIAGGVTFLLGGLLTADISMHGWENSDVHKLLLWAVGFGQDLGNTLVPPQH